MRSIFRPGHARGKRQRAANDLCHGMPLTHFVGTANAGLRGKRLSGWPVRNQMTRETSFRKNPSNRRTNPARKSRGIHDLLLPLATREMHSATNHRNRASFRITIAGLYNRPTQRRLCSSDLPDFLSVPSCPLWLKLPLSFLSGPGVDGVPGKPGLAFWGGMTCDVGNPRRFHLSPHPSIRNLKELHNSSPGLTKIPTLDQRLSAVRYCFPDSGDDARCPRSRRFQYPSPSPTHPRLA